MSRDFLQRIENLPKSLQQEIFDFIDFLISKNKPARKSSPKKSSLRFKWQGALKGKYKNISSVELQHKIQYVSF